MEYRTDCTHKGCRKNMRPVVDTKTLKAYCGECDLELSHISEFMRRQMASYGQVRSNIKTRVPWSIKCQECSAEGLPKLFNDKLFCEVCKKELTKLTKPFVESLKIHLLNKKE